MPDCQDLPKESKDKSSESKGSNVVDKASVKESKEAQDGMPKLVQERQKLIQALKDGATSGISHDFGKPTFSGLETSKPAKDAKPAEAPNSRALETTKSEDSSKSKPADSSKNESADAVQSSKQALDGGKQEQAQDASGNSGYDSGDSANDAQSNAAKKSGNEKPASDNDDDPGKTNAAEEREAEQSRGKNSEEIGEAKTDLQAVTKAENEVGRTVGSVSEKTSSAGKVESTEPDDTSDGENIARGGQFEKGMRELNQQRQKLVEFLKSGGSSGISADFGKPQFFDGSINGGIEIDVQPGALAQDLAAASSVFTNLNSEKLDEQIAPTDIKETKNLGVLNKDETLMDRLSQHSEAENEAIAEALEENPEHNLKALAEINSANRQRFAEASPESFDQGQLQHLQAQSPELQLKQQRASDQPLKPERALSAEQSRELTEAIKHAAEIYLSQHHNGVLPLESQRLLDAGIKRAVDEMSGISGGDHSALSHKDSYYPLAKQYEAASRKDDAEVTGDVKINGVEFANGDDYPENAKARCFRGVENSSQVDGTLFRGANPGGSNDQNNPWSAEKLISNLQDMQKRGVTYVVDFEDRHDKDPLIAMRIAAEKDACDALGIKFVSISMDHGGPNAQQKAQFLDTINAAKRNGEKVYCHCREGRDRTGFMVAYAQEQLNEMSPDRAHAQDVENGYNDFKRVLYPKLNVPDNKDIP